jgi:hypothetical protein
MEKWVNSKVAAEHLGKDAEWLTSNAGRLKIPHTRLGRQFRFKLTDLDKWMSENSTNAVATVWKF